MGMSFLLPPNGAWVNPPPGARPGRPYGKPRYLPPEVCLNQYPYDPIACDVWGAVITLFHMVLGEPLYNGCACVGDPVFTYFVAAGGLSPDMRHHTEEIYGVATNLEPDDDRRRAWLDILINEAACQHSGVYEGIQLCDLAASPYPYYKACRIRRKCRQLSRPLLELLQMCLHFNPRERWSTVARIRESEWMTQDP